MKLINILATLLEEHGCQINIKRRKNYINFRPPSNKIKDFRLEVDDNQIFITRIYTRSKSLRGQTFFMPETKRELTIDIYNPKSLDIIREWFQTL